MPEVQVAVNKVITFTGCPLMIEYEGDIRVLVIVDPLTGTQYRLPLEADGARQIGQQLISSLPIVSANEMPRDNGGG